MAKYSDIKGFTVQTLSTDTVASQFAGGTWASGASVPTGAYSVIGFGTQTAALAGGGYRGDPGYTNDTFEYDGTSWTSGGALTASAGQAREGHGVLTAGGVVAGYKTSGNTVIANYEQYDGTSFTEQNDLNTARQDLAATGSTTAALGFGGTTSVGPGSTQEGLTNVESYNGSSWTEITEVNTGRVRGVSFPGAPAPTAIFVGGSNDSTLYANVETYNGSAWTEITDLNTARSSLAGAGQAQTDGIVFGGAAPSTTGATENWNGTTWTELADLGTARNSLAGAGTGAASALAAMGYSTAVSALTEEFTAPSVFTKITEGQLYFNSTTNTFKETITDIPGASFASGGNMNSPGSNAGGASNGTPTATLVFAGDRPSRSTITEQYDGSSWTEVNDMNEGRNNLGGFGTYNAANGFGGGESTTVNVVSNESWNGSSWTEVNNLNTARAYVAGCGLQTAGLAIGNSPNSGITESFDGTSFTEVGDLNTGRYVGMASGSPTAAILTGGANPSDGSQAVSEQFDGTTWTEVADLNTGRQGGGRFGNKSSQIVAGGYDGSSNVAVTEFFNGTSWTEVADLSIGRNSGGNMSSGTGISAGILFGGTDPGGAATEEWTADLANKTITSS